MFANSRFRFHAFDDIPVGFVTNNGLCQGFPVSSLFFSFVIEGVKKIAWIFLLLFWLGIRGILLHNTSHVPKTWQTQRIVVY